MEAAILCRETRGYWKLKKEALDRAWCRTRFAKRLWTCRKTEWRRMTHQYVLFQGNLVPLSSL